MIRIRKQNIFDDRFCSLYLFFLIFLAISFLTRTVILVKALPVLDLGVWLLVKIYSVGLFYDIVTMLYFAIPFVLYLTAVPDSIFHSKLHKPAVYISSFAVIYLLVFSSFAEYLFFDEFGTRFNFIAVDYLIYTTEVVRNIRESYPMPAIMSAIGIISLLLLLTVRKYLDISINNKTSLKQRAQKSIIFLFLALLPILFVDQSLSKISSNNYANELSSNGIYNFFAALKNNQIDYETFYATKNNDAVFKKLRDLLKESNNTFLTNNIFDISREIKNDGKEKRLNVVVVIVESLSAEYLGIFGNKDGLTPNLDKLAHESLLFTNLHATGTRTDRGLESVTLSVPPTPGRSIVKRPDNENMFSWGFIMKDRGYDTKFIYGGYGYFDNMNYFSAITDLRLLTGGIFPKAIYISRMRGVCAMRTCSTRQ